MIKDIIRTGIFLFIVTAISGILLAFTENITAPIIQNNQRIAEEKAQNLVLPSLRFSDNITSKDSKHTYRVGFDKNGKVTGAIFKVSPKGFGGIINIMVGINLEGRVINYKILSLSETPGLGSKLTSETFTNNMKNLLETNPSPIFMVKKDGGNVDAVTAATISSRAFCKGIQEAKDLFNSLKDEIAAVKFIPANVNKNENTDKKDMTK